MTSWSPQQGIRRALPHCMFMELFHKHSHLLVVTLRYQYLPLTDEETEFWGVCDSLRSLGHSDRVGAPRLSATGHSRGKMLLVGRV